MAVNSFGLRIVASDKVFYEGRGKIIVFPQKDGEKAVLAHHEDMMMALVPGEMRFQTEDGKWHIAAVSAGFAQVINNRVTVLVLSAERPEDIDRKRAQEAKDMAEEKLRQKQSQMQYYRTQATLARAMARLRVSDQKHKFNL